MIIMKNKLIRIIFLIIILSVVFVPKIINRLNSKNTINDYYEYINKDFIDSKPIEEGKNGWSMIEIYQDEVDEEIKKITNDLIKSNNKNINIIYKNYTNYNERNRLGIKPLQKYINGINKSKNIDELINEIYKVENDLKLNLLTNIRISKDFKDSSKYIVYFYPLSFNFGSETTMYSNSDYDSYIAIFQKYLNRLFKLYGYNEKEARKISNDILAMKKEIASKSKKTDDYLDLISYYNKIDKNDLQSIYTNINIEKYLSLKGINNQEYSIVDKNNYKAFNEYLNNNNLSTLKNYCISRILDEYAQILSEDYEKLMFDLSNELQGEKKDFDHNEELESLIQMFFDDVIEEEYAKRTFTEKDKKFITDLIDEIIEYYKNDINSLKWMTKETKEKAIFKLNNIKINVGLVNNEIYSDKYKLKEKDNLFNNTLSIINYTYNRNLSYLKDPSKDASLMNTYTVNAYYSPQDNSINFPCASIKFKTSDNYFESLGELGMVIAHEITHAFDNNGRMFNEKGEYYDWWAKQDSENFEKLSNNIVDYYSKYTVLGINVDGKRTLGENIADLGSIKCITSLAEKHNAKNEDYKRMYEHFAKWSAMNYNDQMTKLLVTSDTHSPNNVRVNATLSSTNKFYEVYNIKKNDKMYKNENERVGIW